MTIATRYFTRCYTIRKVNQSKPHTGYTTSVPLEMISEFARRAGLTPDEFIAKYNARWAWGDRQEVYMEFVEK